ncbi:MAG: heme-binding domain-containing protein [Saprospiraceae bacterium]|nr:heme-binding domain-containing protein [Saprospiraceae bacterium]
MNKYLRYVLLALAVFLIVAQLFPIDKSAPEVDPKEDFLQLADPPAEVARLIKTVCYDCHSYEVNYPWYTSVAPVSWWIDHHIEEGREHLNFSIWGTYDLDKRAHKMEEAAEEVEEEHMPLNSYTWMHSEARLSEEQRNRLVAWFEVQEERQR